MQKHRMALVLFLVLPACSRTPDAPPPDVEPTRLYCGDRVVEVRYAGEHAWLTVGETTHLLTQVVAASGAKYQARDDTSTTLWNQGESTLVIVGGERFVECSTQAPTPHAAFVARGHEPEWQLTIDGDGLSLTRELGAMTLRAPAPAVQDSSGMRRYTATIEGQLLVATVLEQPCADSMSGMPHPQHAIVAFGGEELHGCGGTTEEFLQRGEWIVEDVDGKGIVDDSRLTLQFGADGRVAGLASCNNYGGQYTLSGEGIGFSALFNTRKACAPALMAQETLYLAILAEVSQLELAADGALHLRTADGRQLTARRG